MTKEEIQFDLLKTELDLTQRQMDKYDQLSGMTKTWAVTLWAASLGWSFQIKREEIILLSAFIALAFWMLDAANKNFRRDYKKRRDEAASALRKIFQGQAIGQEVVSPDLPLHQWRHIFKEIFQPHIFILYLSLILVSLIIFLAA
jgi:hypothetical protein